jgi:hypothetical protein
MIKVTEDNFVWKVLTESQAKFIFISGIFELYLLFDDGTDTLIESIEEIGEAAKEGAQLVIEVGFYESI